MADIVEVRQAQLDAQLELLKAIRGLADGVGYASRSQVAESRASACADLARAYADLKSAS